MPDRLLPPPKHPPAWRDRLLATFRRRRWRGFLRLFELLKPQSARRMLRVPTRYGPQFFLNPWDYVDDFVIREGFYESEVLEAVRPALGPGAVLWVVGCNFGLHAVTAKCLHPGTRVVAFEPLPSMGARLAENCELNGVEVELHAYALSDAAGVLPFFVNTAGNPAMSTLHPDPAGTYDLRMTVAALTAAEIIARGLAPAPTVAIIDAEGAEAEVLRGFGPLQAHPVLRTIVFEAPNDFLSAVRPADLHQLLASAGFTLRQLPRNENTAHALSNFVATRAGAPPSKR